MEVVSLKDLYDECNKLYFNNELPQDIVVVWSNRMTTKAGCCTIRRKKQGGIVSFKAVEITLSIPYHTKYPEEVRSTLVHEMIHIKYPWEVHGLLFHREMDRLNKEYNLGIKLTITGLATVNYIYTCEVCQKEYPRTNINKRYKDYTCKCGGDLIERKVEHEEDAG